MHLEVHKEVLKTLIKGVSMDVNTIGVLVTCTHKQGLTTSKHPQDGIWSEGPYGVELWPSFRVYRSRGAKGDPTMQYVRIPVMVAYSKAA